VRTGNTVNAVPVTDLPPGAFEQRARAATEAAVALAVHGASEKVSSRYVGVIRNESNNAWTVQYSADGSLHNIPTDFSSEEEAARAFDTQQRLRTDGPASALAHPAVNFPKPGEIQAFVDESEKECLKRQKKMARKIQKKALKTLSKHDVEELKSFCVANFDTLTEDQMDRFVRIFFSERAHSTESFQEEDVGSFNIDSINSEQLCRMHKYISDCISPATAATEVGSKRKRAVERNDGAPTQKNSKIKNECPHCVAGSGKPAGHRGRHKLNVS
jgi:hypothetical protein